MIACGPKVRLDGVIAAIGNALICQLNWVLTVANWSVTDTTVWYVAAVVGTPEMRPVVGSIVRPAGRPTAEYVSGLLSGSSAKI